MSGKVIGRLHWDDRHRSPWMSFPNKSAFLEWARAIRRARPGTRTEFAYYDGVWTAEAMLRKVQEEEQPGVAELRLDATTYGVLHRNGITSVDQLADMTFTEVLALKGIGPSRLLEIQQRLTEAGRSLLTTPQAQSKREAGQ